MSEPNETQEELLTRVLRLVTLQRETELSEYLSVSDLPYDVITANAMLNLGIHMLMHMDYPKDRLEHLLLDMASKLNQAHSAETN